MDTPSTHNGDDFSGPYLDRMNARDKQRRSEAGAAWLAERAQAQQVSQPQGAPSVPPVGAPSAPRKAPVAAAAAAPADDSPGFFAEAGKALVGGAADAVANVMNTVADGEKWIEKDFLKLRDGQAFIHPLTRQPMVAGAVNTLPEFRTHEALDNKTTGGSIARSITQFMVPFTSAMKGLKAAQVVAKTKLGTAAIAAGAGAVTDFSAFDPHAERLSNLISDQAKEHPALHNAVTEYLKADPSDSNIEGRFKNAVEGLGLGALADGVFMAARALRGVRHAQGAKKLEAELAKLDEKAAAGAQVPSAPTPHPTEPADVPLARQLELVPKDAQGSPKAVAKAVPDAPKAVAKAVPDATTVAGKAVPDAPKIPKAPDWALVEKQAADSPITVVGHDGVEKTLDEVVTPILEKPAHTLSEADRATAGSYRDMQKAAMDDLGVPPTAAAAPTNKVGDTVFYGNGENSGEVIGLSKNGKVIIRDDATGAKKAVTPDAPDELMGEIKANNEALLTAGAKAQQGGFVAPQLLAHMAGAGIGGVTGYNSAPDNASMSERLARAGIGALAGYAGARVGVSKILNHAERKLVSETDPFVKELLDPRNAGLVPHEAAVKVRAAPALPKEKVVALADALIDGDAAKIAAELGEPDFNLARISDAADIETILNSTSKVFEKEISEAKRGVQTFKMISELADEVGSTPQNLAEVFGMTENLSARVLGARRVLSSSALLTRDMAKAAVGGGDLALLAFRKQMHIHTAIQAQVKGVQTEVGRTLAQFRIMSTKLDMSKEEVSQLLEQMGGRDANAKFAAMLDEVVDAKTMNNILEKSAGARTADALFEGWRAGLLSSPATHVANFTGNMLTALFSPAERLGAAAAGALLRNPDAIRAGEAKALVSGMVNGAIDALRMTRSSWETIGNAGGQLLKGDYQGAMGHLRKNEATMPEAIRALFNDSPGHTGLYGGVVGDITEHAPAISAEAFGLSVKSNMGKTADILGAALRLPYRALAGADALFQNIHYVGEIHAQAYRRAASEGLQGDDLVQAIAKYVSAPDEAMQAAARKSAAEGTFQQPLEGTMLHVQRFAGPAEVRARPNGRPSNMDALLKLPVRAILPFVKTPTNIFSYVGQRTPGLNLLSSRWRNDFAAGGHQREAALSRLALGSTIGTAAFALAQAGYITGGMEKDRASETLAGIPEYSVKIGEKWVSFVRTDPLGLTLGLAADMQRYASANPGDADNAAATFLLAISRSLTSKTFLSGIASFVDAVVSGDGKKWERYFQRQAASLVPYSAASRALRKEGDEFQREVWSVRDSMMNTLPGFSTSLPPVVNILGEEVRNKGGLGPDILSPWATTEANPSPAAQELGRLNMDIKKPSKSIRSPGGGPVIDLSPQQYYRMMKLMGNEAKDGNDQGFKEWLDEFVQSDEYKALPELANSPFTDAKERIIKQRYNWFGSLARQKLLEEFPDLAAKLQANRENSIRALTGDELFPLDQ